MNMTSDVKTSYDFFVKYCSSCLSTMTQLSQDSANGVYLVNDSTPAFNFDRIKDMYFDENVKSADALYFTQKDTILLIEFKNGNKIKSFKKNCRIKGKHSKIIFRYIMSYIGSKINLDNIKFKYVVVINSTSAGLPSTSLGVGYAKRCKPYTKTQFYSSLVSNLVNQNIFGTQEYYDSIDIWVSNMFTPELQKA